MAIWLWVVVTTGAVLVLGAAVFGAMRGRERRVVHRREKTAELRREAEQRTRRAEERERVAREQQERARAEREEAASVGARADRLDPDRED